MITINKLIEVFPGYSVNKIGEVYSTKFGKEINMKPWENSKGYLLVRLSNKGKSKNYLVHRLVGAAFLGLDLSNSKIQVNHLNMVKGDNRLENLELCNHRENTTHRSQNMKKTTSQYTGVYWHKRDKKWRASITINGKKVHLGSFTDELAASQVYQDALLKINHCLHPHFVLDHY